MNVRRSSHRQPHLGVVVTRITREESTFVNLRWVGDLVEEVVAKLRQEHLNRQLVIRLPLPEFRMRYGMYYPV